MSIVAMIFSSSVGTGQEPVPALPLCDTVLISDTIQYHAVRITKSDNSLLPWYSADPGKSCDFVMNQVGYFWDSMRTDLTTLPYYLNLQQLLFLIVTVMKDALNFKWRIYVFMMFVEWARDLKHVLTSRKWKFATNLMMTTTQQLFQPSRQKCTKPESEMTKPTSSGILKYWLLNHYEYNNEESCLMQTLFFINNLTKK